MMVRSRIYLIRRALLRLSMWGDPAAKLKAQDQEQADRVLEDAKAGSLEAQHKLRLGLYAYQYIHGER